MRQGLPTPRVHQRQRRLPRRPLHQLLPPQPLPPWLQHTQPPPQPPRPPARFTPRLETQRLQQHNYAHLEQ
jgi:hypothetical protein